MKKSTASAIRTITAQMILTADRDGVYDRQVRAYEDQGMTTSDAQGCVDADYRNDAAELFDDCAEATRDMIIAGLNGADYAATAYRELGFAPRVAANLARASLLFLDGNNRATQIYIDEVANALEVR